MSSFVGFMTLLITEQLFHSELKLVFRRLLASADVEGMATFDRFARYSLQMQPGSVCKFCVFPSSHALDSVPWLESFGNSVLHCLHPFDTEISKTIQLSQNISTFYMCSIMIIFQFYENNHWSCQQQHRNSCTATHECVLITFWSGKTNHIADGFTGRRGFDQKCTVLKLTGWPRAKLFYTKPPLTEPPSLLGWECPDGIFRSLLILHFCCLTLHSLQIHWRVYLALYFPADLEKRSLLLLT